MGELYLYGCTGYTGGLLARHAIERGLRPILGGRNAAKVEPLAQELGLESRIVGIQEGDALRRALRGTKVCLNAAGPFSQTARQVMEACLQEGVHYLDVTGEIDVFEQAAALHERARKAEVMLLPGVGFDVVPSDNLAAFVAKRVERPKILRIGIQVDGSLSRGTAKTMLEALGAGLRVRRGGEIRTLKPGSLVHKFDFGRGRKKAVAVSWGDVSTAWTSTRVPDVEVYFRAGITARLLNRLTGTFSGLLGSAGVQSTFRKRIDAGSPGPTPEQLETGRSVIVCEVTGETRGQARLKTPNGYALTRDAAIEAAIRVLQGQSSPGYQTPSSLFGEDFVLSLPGCERSEFESSRASS